MLASFTGSPGPPALLVLLAGLILAASPAQARPMQGADACRAMPTALCLADLAEAALAAAPRGEWYRKNPDGSGWDQSHSDEPGSLVNLRLKAGDYSGATATWRRFLREPRQYFDLRVALARLDAGEIEEAAVLLKRVDFDPWFDLQRYYKIDRSLRAFPMALAWVGRGDEAFAFLRKADTVVRAAFQDPDGPLTDQYFHVLAGEFLAIGDPERALAALRGKRGGEGSLDGMRLAREFARQGRPDLALSALRLAMDAPERSDLDLPISFRIKELRLLLELEATLGRRENLLDSFAKIERLSEQLADANPDQRLAVQIDLVLAVGLKGDITRARQKLAALVEDHAQTSGGSLSDQPWFRAFRALIERGDVTQAARLRDRIEPRVHATLADRMRDLEGLARGGFSPWLGGFPRPRVKVPNKREFLDLARETGLVVFARARATQDPKARTAGLASLYRLLLKLPLAEERAPVHAELATIPLDRLLESVNARWLLGSYLRDGARLEATELARQLAERNRLELQDWASLIAAGRQFGWDPETREIQEGFAEAFDKVQADPHLYNRYLDFVWAAKRFLEP